MYNNGNTISTTKLTQIALTSNMHEYFFFEDLDATKLTKLILHFYHFSVICYAFYKISAELNNFGKP